MEPVVEEVGRAVGQQAVALHLAEPDAAAQLAALYGLAGQGVDRAHGPDLFFLGGGGRGRVWGWRGVGCGRSCGGLRVGFGGYRGRSCGGFAGVLLACASERGLFPWGLPGPGAMQRAAETEKARPPAPAGARTWNLSDTMCRSRW